MQQMPLDSPVPKTRSFLFVPANRPDRYQKAAESGADIVCIDLEDAVPPEAKIEARTSLRTFFQSTNSISCRWALRINSLSTMEGVKDMIWLEQQSLTPNLILLPKTSTSKDVTNLNGLLREINIKCPVLAIIETAEGLDNATEIAKTPNVQGICFGSADYTAETGGTMDWDSLVYPRGRIVQAAACGEVLAIDGAWLSITDTEGLSIESSRLPGLGFDGRVAIHPSQIKTIHEAFLPSPADIERAKKIIDAATTHGQSAIAVDGRMVDRPVILWAQRILKRVS